MSRAVLLQAYLDEVVALPFRPGRHDCAIFAANWVKRVTGRDLARGWRSTYRSLQKGHELLQAAGYEDHIAMAAAHFEDVPPALARTGDLAVVEDCFGIFSADRVFVLRPDGLGHLSRLEASRAFKI